MKTMKKIIMLVLFISLMTSCVVMKQDAYTISETTATKEITLKLMDLSNEPYSNHVTTIDSVKSRLQSLLSYEKSKKNNTILVGMFKVLVKEKGKVYGFFNIWKDKTVLGSYFIGESKEEVKFAFDKILELENQKDK